VRVNRPVGFRSGLTVDQAFQLGADTFGVFGFGADAQREADVFRAQGEKTKMLLPDGAYADDLFIKLSPIG
jgi:hypothetical protein